MTRGLLLAIAMSAALLTATTAQAAAAGAHIALSCAFGADVYCSRLLAELHAAGHQVDKLPDGADLQAELAAPGAVVQVRQAPWEVVVLVRRDGILETRTYRPDAGEQNPAQTVAVQVAEGLRATFSQRVTAPEPKKEPAAQSTSPRPEPPAAARVERMARPVRFDGEGRALMVSVDRNASCVTPCELALEPGPHQVSVVGREGEKELVLPDSASLVRVSSRSNTQLGLGIAGVTLGVPVAAVGLVLAGGAAGAASPDTDYTQLVAIGAGVGVAGLVMAVLGGASLATMGGDGVEVESAKPGLEAVNLSITSSGAGAVAAFRF
ncbi:MAG: hypothetical protein QM765_47125 [Myxococcales bacterium]